MSLDIGRDRRSVRVTSPARQDGAATIAMVAPRKEMPKRNRAADHLGRLHGAVRKRRGVLPRRGVATLHRALVPQHLQPRALDQGAGDRGDAQGDPCRRGHRGGPAEGCASDREAARPAADHCAPSLWRRRSRRRWPTTPSPRNTGGASAPTIRWSAFCARSGGAPAWSAHSRRAIGPQSCRGQAAPHRRHRVVDQTLLEHRTAEGPADERCHHRLSQCRAPLSPNQMCEKLWTLPTIVGARWLGLI